MLTLYYKTSVGFEFVKSLEVTLCGGRGYKPSVNTYIITVDVIVLLLLNIALYSTEGKL